MAPPTWAYQVDNFNPAPYEELVCSICQAVFCDPVQSPCNHVFCRNCIGKWLESNRNCPICRNTTTRSSLQEVVPLVKSIIMKLNLRCHNHVRGCSEQFPLESCESHIKDCAYELVQCRNKPCKMMFMKKDMLEHEMHGCAHSYIRCTTCKLKISSREPNFHDCIKDLRKKLKEKTIKLKKSNQKIKKLKSELKASKENDYSETSSFESSSAFASNILFEHIDSEVSSVSSVDSSSYVSDSDENPFWISASGDLIYDSIEFSHSSSPVNVGGFNVIQVNESPSVMEIEDVEPQVRRPAKRRFNSLVAYSTNEKEERIDDPLPSRNRTLQRKHPSRVTVNDEINLGAAGPSYLSTADSSTSINDSSPRNHDRKVKSKSRLRATTQVTQPTNTAAIARAVSANGNPIFERTVSLLEQYNIESDPEWLPPHDHSTIYEMDDTDSNSNDSPNRVTKSEESSISGLDSDSSYADAADAKTEDLLYS